MKNIKLFLFFIIFLISCNNKNGILVISNEGVIENISKSIVYILPYKKCNSFWADNYGDRIYYYVYGNLANDRSLIENDFQSISEIYERVIIIIPAEDTSLFLENLSIINSIAENKGLEVIYAIFPNDKYGKEQTYLDQGSPMYNLVLFDMQYLIELNPNNLIAVWYGWKCRAKSKDIVDYYNSLPSDVKEKYAVWLDEEYAKKIRWVYLHGLPSDVLIITEAYDKKKIASYSGFYTNQLLVTGYKGAKSLNDWKTNIQNLLSVCQTTNIGIWMFYDIGDGSGEADAAFIDEALIDF